MVDQSQEAMQEAPLPRTAMRSAKSLFIAVSLLVPAVAIAGPVDVAATWTAQHCAEVDDAIFSDPEGWASEPSHDLPAVSVRIGGEFNLETQIWLCSSATGLVARVVQAEGTPICQQLQELKKAHPELDVAQAIPLIEVKRLRISERSAPELGKVYRDLQRVHVSVWPYDALFAPARGITVNIRGVHGGFSLSYPEPDPSASSVAYTKGASTPQREMSRWVERLLKSLGVKPEYDP
jgi:hypothetical protein